MTIALGIDTGGTYTDAVLVRLDQTTDDGRNASAVLAGAKALTTRRDLAIGIGQAIAAVFDQTEIDPAEVGLVALSTTLATNAIVEGQGSNICLILVGYDPELIRQFGFERELATQDVVYAAGGHDVVGDQVEPLDETAVRRAILSRIGRVEAFAVSSYFSVRNPSHELRVRELVAELTRPAGGGLPLPITCGHELTSRLNSVKRATTAALNARLIPLLRELIATVRQTLDRVGIVAPLMVVKGDGSLVRSDWALRRPIETILSGPAASVVGAWHLAGRRDSWVVDVGGTTTDIAALRAGRPRLNPRGAQVGRWQTMVEAVDVHTVGLGGDSEVKVRDRALLIGPQRVVPLCMLAAEHPTVLQQLELQLGKRPNEDEAGMFVLHNRRPARHLNDDESKLLELLQRGPQPVHRLKEVWRYGMLVRQMVDRLAAERLVLRCGFTPTDALHCLGRFQRWNADASRLGAELLAAQMGVSAEAFCRRVVEGVPDRVTTELVTKVLADEGTTPDWTQEPAAAALLGRALQPLPDSDLRVRFALGRPVVAIGAPVEAYFPRVGNQLNTEIVIPPHAEVANAVGAVVGGVVQQVRVLIHPVSDGEGFRLHLFDGVHDFGKLTAALDYAEQVVPPHLTAQAQAAGAGQVEVKMVRQDLSAPVRGGWGSEIFLETELTFTAVGRPSLAHNH